MSATVHLAALLAVVRHIHRYCSSNLRTNPAHLVPSLRIEQAPDLFPAIEDDLL